MGIAQIVKRLLIAPVADIGDADKRSAVMESTGRRVTVRIAQFMAEFRGVYIAVFPVYFTDGTCFIERMTLKFRILCFCASRYDRMFLTFDCDHIRVQFQAD